MFKSNPASKVDPHFSSLSFHLSIPFPVNTGVFTSISISPISIFFNTSPVVSSGGLIDGFTFLNPAFLYLLSIFTTLEIVT